MKKLLLLCLLLTGCWSATSISYKYNKPVAEVGTIIEVFNGSPKTSSRVFRLAHSLKLDSQPFPGWWRIVLLNPTEWQEGLKQYNLVGVTDTAYTFLGSNITYINAEYVDRTLDNKVRHTLAHEGGHLSCVCQSEAEAEAIARKLE